LVFQDLENLEYVENLGILIFEDDEYLLGLWKMILIV
jgi:hypothetical protein